MSPRASSATLETRSMWSMVIVRFAAFIKAVSRRDSL